MKKIQLIAFVFLFFSGLTQADIPRFKEVHPHLYRGGQPTERADYRELKAMGIRTILNLRETPFDVAVEQKIAHELDLNFFHIPTSSILAPPKRDMKLALEIINNPQYQPVFLHCRHGKDRTGMVVGLYRVYFDKWTAERGYEEMVDHGFGQYYLGLSGFYWTFAKLKDLFS